MEVEAGRRFGELAKSDDNIDVMMMSRLTRGCGELEILLLLFSYFKLNIKGDVIFLFVIDILDFF